MAEVRKPKEYTPKQRLMRGKKLGYRLNTNVRSLSRKKSNLQQNTVSLGEESPQEVASPWYIISRDSVFQQYWYPWMSLLINYSSFTTLFYMSYDWPGPFFVLLDRIVWANFVLDLILEFFTDYKNEEGEVITNHTLIIMRYLSGWFIFDLIAVIPLSEFGYPMDECYLRIIRLLKVKRGLDLLDGSFIGPLISLINPPKNQGETLNRGIMVKYAISFMQIIGQMLFTTYALAACFFWWSSFTLNWENVHAAHFLTMFKMENMTGMQKLNRSCYFIASTLSTVGYGDFFATNMYEKLMLMGILLIGIVQFSLIVANFNALLAEIDENSSEGEGMNDLTTWIGQLEITGQKISQSLKDRIFAHFQYYWENDRLGILANCWWKEQSVDELIEYHDKYLEEMPKSCRQGVVEFLFSDLAGKYPMFFIRNSTFRLAVTFHFQPRFYKYEEMIVEEEDLVQEVVFVTKGKVTCGVTTKTGFKELLFYPDRCIIGDYEALRHKPAIASFRATHVHGVQAFMLPASIIPKILKAYYPQQFLRILINTQVKGNYILNTIRKFRKEKEVTLLNPFQQLKLRLVASRLRNPAVIWKNPEKTWSEADLNKVKLEYERRRCSYEGRKSALLAKILKKVGHRK